MQASISTVEAFDPPELRDPGSILKRVNDLYFHGVLRPRITYGPRRRRKGQPVGIVCGQYNCTTNTITLNRVLQDSRVPLWYVEWVVYHELLHMIHGGPHTRAFREDEATHPDTKRAAKWEQSHLFAIYGGK